MNVKYVPTACYISKDGEKFYQYTMIDEASRERLNYSKQALTSKPTPVCYFVVAIPAELRLEFLTAFGAFGGVYVCSEKQELPPIFALFMLDYFLYLCVGIAAA